MVLSSTKQSATVPISPASSECMGSRQNSIKKIRCHTLLDGGHSVFRRLIYNKNTKGTKSG